MARKPCRRALLTDKQWAKIAPLLPVQDQSKGGRPWCDPRLVVEGIIWILVTGAPWWALPNEYPSFTTCWRWLRRWQREGVWEKIERTLLGELDGRRRIKWEECFADATFASAQKGAMPSAQPARGKARR
jgi:transposase